MTRAEIAIQNPYEDPFKIFTSQTKKPQTRYNKNMAVNQRLTALQLLNSLSK